MVFPEKGVEEMLLSGSCRLGCMQQRSHVFFDFLTERDYSGKVILCDRHSKSTKVSNIMSTNVPAISPTSTLEDCMALMAVKKVRYLPVFKGKELSGIISQSDIIKEIIRVQKETINHLEKYIHSGI